MIRFALITSTLILLAGCATTDQKADAEATLKQPERKITAVEVQPEPPKTRVLPINGRIASVNDKLRFVILDFTNSRRPELEQRLSVYRMGQKVAEIKVSGPFRNTTVAADIVAGEVKYGDEVKTE